MLLDRLIEAVCELRPRQHHTWGTLLSGRTSLSVDSLGIWAVKCSKAKEVSDVHLPRSGRMLPGSFSLFDVEVNRKIDCECLRACSLCFCSLCLPAHESTLGIIVFGGIGRFIASMGIRLDRSLCFKVSVFDCSYTECMSLHLASICLVIKLE